MSTSQGGMTVTLDAAEAIATHTLVTGAGGYVAANGGGVAGVTTDLVAKAANEPISVQQGGRAKVRAGAAVAEGALLMSDTEGKAITAVAPCNVVGQALEAASAEDVIFSMVHAPSYLAA